MKASHQVIKRSRESGKGEMSLELVHFHGLNCYLNCFVSAAASLGLHYEDAFSTLWSEVDFRYDEKYNLFITKRMVANIEAMGAGLSRFNWDSRGHILQGLARLPEGQLVLVGMDAYDIPWSPVHQLLHDPHYFFARNEKTGSLSCFDPTYNCKAARITHESVASHAFEICLIDRVARKPLCVSVEQEALDVLRTHPQTEKQLIADIQACAGERQRNAERLAKYADALMNNRYIYRYYLQSLPNASKQYEGLFNHDFFLRWEAVKNGLFKASLMRDGKNTRHDVCELVSTLFQEELVMASRMAI